MIEACLLSIIIAGGVTGISLEAVIKSCTIVRCGVILWEVDDVSPQAVKLSRETKTAATGFVDRNLVRLLVLE